MPIRYRCGRGHSQSGSHRHQSCVVADSCLYLSGPGPSIGPAENQLHEWTPVQDLRL